MLYTPFRKVLQRYDRAVREFGGHTLPDFMEEPAIEHAALLALEEATRRQVRLLLKYFPKVPPGGFGEDSPLFGPVLHPEDMRIATSVLLPLALSLGDGFPTESYGPISFLREKCEVLAATIEVYAGWRSYTTGKYPTKWQGFPQQVPEGAFPGVKVVSLKARHLASLFANMSASAARCQQSLEFQLGKRVDRL